MKNIMMIMGLLILSLNLNAAEKGKMTGGSEHAMPEWFKESFLDLGEDVDEANEKNKHVMLFLTLNGCPYCTKMLDENFKKGTALQAEIEQHFDVIGLNIKGSREIVFSDDKTLTEKEYAKELQVHYTPTLIFLNSKREPVVRVDGYRSPQNFKYILEYVKSRSYEKMTLVDFVDKVNDKTLYKLRPSQLYSNLTDLSDIKGPLAVIFEDGSCTQCDYMYDTTFKNRDVISELEKFTVVRLDANSDKEIIDVNGEKTSPKAWAKKADMTYRPGILLFNEGKQVAKIDALLYSFHFKEMFRYVSGKHYQQYPTFLDYLNPRQQELLGSGVDIDISDK
jgi:thioredoxin-related protein